MCNQESNTLQSSGTDSTRIVKACPHCDAAGQYRPHKTNAQNVRDPEQYANTDYTCKQCGSYFNEDQIVERPAKKFRGGGRSGITKKLLEADPNITRQGDGHA